MAAQLETRVGALEANLQALTNDVSTLTQAVSDLRLMLQQQGESFKNMLADFERTIVTTQTAQQRDLSQSLKDLNQERGQQISDLYDRISACGRTNWANVIAGISTIVLIVSVLGGVAVSPLYSGQRHVQEVVQQRCDGLDRLLSMHQQTTDARMDEMQYTIQSLLQHAAAGEARLDLLEKRVHGSVMTPEVIAPHPARHDGSTQIGSL